MSLDISKLEKVRELASGLVQAQCPACAEGGSDRTGDHLRIYPDGRFGCAVHPKDGAHRKRIFALAGDRKPGTFKLRVNVAPAVPVALSVKASLIAYQPAPPKTELEKGVPGVPALSNKPSALVGLDSGTPGTGKVELRAYESEASPRMVEKLKDLESAVPGVPRKLVSPLSTEQPLPFLSAGGDLIIPFEAPSRYHWWNGGQSVAATLAEVMEQRHEQKLKP
jgi:hypothetical protein